MDVHSSKKMNDHDPTSTLNSFKDKTKCNGCAKVGPGDRSSKTTRTHEGWKFQWTEPKKGAVKAVVRGPFVRPRLLKALPYVVVSFCKNCPYEVDPIRKLRSGIPDPWIEYITWKEGNDGNKGIAKRDLRCSWEFVRYTDYIWSRKGLPMVQGIPDPWKIDEYCMCEEENEISKEKKKKKRKSSLKETNKIDGEKTKRKISKSIQTDKLKEELKKTLRNSENFEKVNRKISQLSEELKLKAAEKKNRVLEVEKYSRSSKDSQLRKKYKKSERQHDTIMEESCICSDKSMQDIPKEKKSKHREKDDSKYYKDKRKTSSESKRSSLKSKRRTSSSCQPCAGKCGRVSRTSEEIKEDLQYSCGCRKTANSNVSTGKSSLGREDLKKYLEEINSRIQITKDALNSSELSSDEDSNAEPPPLKRRTPKTSPRNFKEKRISFSDRERGGGRREKNINAQKSGLLFEKMQDDASDDDRVEIIDEGRKVISELAVPVKANFETSIIPGNIRSNESFYLKDRYEKNSLEKLVQKPKSDTSGDIEQLIIESLSDSE